MVALKIFVKRQFPTFYTKLISAKQKYILIKFKKAYPKTKIFLDTKRKLHAQHNQDYIVYNNFFKNKTDGVFCDVGGNHPLNINNTLYFEELGWCGYVFEPLPYMKQLWDKYRKAKFFQYAASDKEGEVIFNVVKDRTGWEDMLSSVKKTRNIDYGYETESISVRCRPLKDVFMEENITKIDYMSIDVEGHELNVIKGIDFKKVEISVLTIENNSSCCPIYGDDNIREFMFANSFELWGRIVGLDDIYVRKHTIENNDA